jgi:Ca2+:H+ antiporter
LKNPATLPAWTIAAPALGWLLLAGHFLRLGDWYVWVLSLGLLACVMASVHHAEVMARRVGDPYGSLLLAGAVTIIELSLIVSLMVSGGPAATALARDAVFATVMIVLNGIVGTCLLLGGSRFGEQQFGLYGVSASLATIAAIVVLTLVLPNYTTTLPGPVYNAPQLGFVAIVSLALYGAFVFVQTVRHRAYFLPPPSEVAAEEDHGPVPSGKAALLSSGLLILCLGAVVLLAEMISPAIEAVVLRIGAPKAVVGILVAAVVGLPEGLSAIRAAYANHLQTSLNLAFGSALASIGLTIPAVAALSLLTHWTLTLGIDAKSTVLLMLSLLVATLSLGTGRTTVLQGMVHLVIFAVYLFTSVIP